jgi:hypothetical protein
MIGPGAPFGDMKAVKGRKGRSKSQHELLPFLALWAIQYQKDYGLDGLAPVHYDLMVKYGARMDSFKRAGDGKPAIDIYLRDAMCEDERNKG